MDVHVREARPADVPFARTFYFETMRWLIEPIFGWEERQQEESFATWFDLSQARIIVADGADVGWMQTRVTDREIFLGSLYVLPAMQGHGIGTVMLGQLSAEATRVGKPLTLAVMKNNPAVRLYERLGFRLTHEDQYKLYMRLGSTE